MLNRNVYFIREHVGFMKLANTYDILDPESKEMIGIAKEKPGSLVHIFRLFVNKQLLPTKVFVYEGNNPEDESRCVFTIQRGFSLLRPIVNILGPNGQSIGWFKRKLISLGGSFRIFDVSGNEFAMVKGDWKGWNFQFIDKNEQVIGTITKKWSGIGKELFTTADNYVVSLNGNRNAAESLLLLAAGLAIDTVFKER